MPLGDSLDSAIGINLPYNYGIFSSATGGMGSAGDIGLEKYLSFNLKGRSSLRLDRN